MSGMFIVHTNKINNFLNDMREINKYLHKNKELFSSLSNNIVNGLFKDKVKLIYDVYDKIALEVGNTINYVSSYVNDCITIENKMSGFGNSPKCPSAIYYNRTYNAINTNSLDNILLESTLQYNGNSELRTNLKNNKISFESTDSFPTNPQNVSQPSNVSSYTGGITSSFGGSWNTVGSVSGTTGNVGATSPSTTESIPSVSGTITGETVTATVAGPSDSYQDVTITPELQLAYGDLVKLCDELGIGWAIEGNILTSIDELEAYRKEIADLYEKYPGLKLAATETGDLVDRDEDFINAYNRVMELYRIIGSKEGYDNKRVLATTDEERQEVANQIQELLSKYPSLRQLIVNQKLDYLKANPNVESNDKLTNLDFLLGLELTEGKSVEDKLSENVTKIDNSSYLEMMKIFKELGYTPYMLGLSDNVLSEEEAKEKETRLKEIYKKYDYFYRIDEGKMSLDGLGPNVIKEYEEAQKLKEELGKLDYDRANTEESFNARIKELQKLLNDKPELKEYLENTRAKILEDSTIKELYEKGEVPNNTSGSYNLYRQVECLDIVLGYLNEKTTTETNTEFNYLDHIEEIKKEPLAFFFNNPQYFFEKKDLDQYLNDLKENNINIYELDLASGLEGGKNTVDEDSIRNILSLRMEQVLSDPNASAELKSTIERYITPDGHILYGNENYELEEILKDYLTDGEKQYIKDVRHILDDVIKEEDSNYVEVTTLTPNDNYLDYVDDIKKAPLTFYFQNRNYFDNHGVKGEITEDTDMGVLQYKEYLDSIIPIIGEENLDKVDLANGISQFGAVKENVQTLYQTKAYLLANSPKVSEEEKKDLLDYFYGIHREDSKANDIIDSYLTDHEKEYKDNIEGVFYRTVTENLESNSVG